MLKEERATSFTISKTKYWPLSPDTHIHVLPLEKTQWIMIFGVVSDSIGEKFEKSTIFVGEPVNSIFLVFWSEKTFGDAEY